MTNGKEIAWTRAGLYEQIQSIEKKHSLDSKKVLLYVLQPYVASLGYNIFKIDDVDTDVDNENLKITISDNFSMEISLKDFFPDSETTKIFLYLDVYTKEITFYMKALGEWEQMMFLDISKKENDAVYNKMLDFIVSDIVKELYKNKKERLFTEGVLKAKLENKDFENAFVRDVVREELQNPSQQFLTVIATALSKKFSSDSSQNIAKSLQDLNKLGVVDLFSNVIEDIRLEEDYATEPKLTYQKPTRLVSPEPKVEDNKKDFTFDEEDGVITGDTIEEVNYPKDLPTDDTSETIEPIISYDIPVDEPIVDDNTHLELPLDVVEDEESQSLENIFKLK